MGALIAVPSLIEFEERLKAVIKEVTEAAGDLTLY